MTLSERKNKAKRLEPLIGDFIRVTLKTMNTIETPEGAALASNEISGYVLDVDESFLYLGDDMSGYSKLLDLSEIVNIAIIEDIPEELMTFVPEDESVH